MKRSQLLAIALFGTISIIGGLMGMIQAHSLPSLIMGGGGGVLLLFCGARMYRESRSAATIALIISTLFLARFALTFCKTRSLFPHLTMLLFSIWGIWATIAFLRRTPRERVRTPYP